MSKEQYSEQEKIDALRLIRSENVGPVTYRQLVRKFGSAKQALSALPDLAARGGRKNYRLCSKSKAEEEFSAVKAAGGDLLCLGEAAYPPLLAQIDDAPPTLFILGHQDLLLKDSIAIVGARNASANGCLMAKKFAQNLAQGGGDFANGLVVISGLARGIDAAAHEGALMAAQQQGASTIAVLAGGIDHIYPNDHKALCKEIGELGAVISEHPPNIEPQARHFPRRNRLISGLSLGVLVVEAAPRSGSLITARYAADQGREVFAIPGSPMDARSRGTNDLIRNGATLIENADDVFFGLQHRGRSLLEPEPNDFEEMPNPAYGAENNAETYEVILDLLTTNPIAVDEIVRTSNLASFLVNGAILELELGGKIGRHPGNRISLTIDENDF